MNMRNIYLLRSLLTLLFAALFIGPAHSNPSDPLPDLLAYWTGDNTLNDSSGNHNTLANHDATFGPGKINQAFDFNGSSYLSANPNFQMTSSNFTISLWANLNSYSPGYTGGIPNSFIGQSEGGGEDRKWVFYYDNNRNSLGFHVNNYGSNPRYFAEEPAIQAPLNTWDMFTVTGNTSAHTLSFYENGTPLGTWTGAHFSLPNAPITIGEAEGLGWVNGAIDDVRIYDDALSQQQVQNLFDSGKSTYVTPEASSFWLTAGLLMLFGGSMVQHKRRQAQLKKVGPTG